MFDSNGREAGSSVFVFYLDLCTVLDRVGSFWGVLGFEWLVVLICMKRLLDEVWDVRIERAVDLIPVELNAHVEATFSVDCDVASFFRVLTRWLV